MVRILFKTFSAKDICDCLTTYCSTLKIRHLKTVIAMVVKTMKYKLIVILLICVLLYYIFTLTNGTTDGNLYSQNIAGELATSVTSKTQDLHEIVSLTKAIKPLKHRSTLVQRLKNVPKVKVQEVDCKALFIGDPLEMLKADRYHSKLDKMPKVVVPSNEKECEAYLSAREYAREPADDEEANYPIAFSVLIYKDFYQFEKLLRAIYRPQNFYCIHVDAKSEAEFLRDVRLLIDCFKDDKIFISPVSFDVEWATITVLQPEIECMKELWKRFLVDVDSDTNSTVPNQANGKSGKVRKKPKWKYFINLTGQEFPLRTNLELVKILKILNGSNNVEATRARMAESTLQFYDSKPAPGGLKIWKGSVHTVLTREFVDFVLHHRISEELLQYLNDVWVPDEHFFSTLNNNPNLTVPGGYVGNSPETDSQANRFIARFKNWGYPPFGWPCKGKWVRQICNFGVGDLPLLASRDELFANKFDYSYQPLAYDCMEELLYNRTKLEYVRGYYSEQNHPSVSTDAVDHNDDKKLRKKLSSPEIANIIETNKKKYPKLSEGLQNKDHLIFPEKTFHQYGDEQDGQYEPGNSRYANLNYLSNVRSMIHEPGEVDFDHYRNLEFVKNHFHVPDDWTIDDYNQSLSRVDLMKKKTNSPT